jgi:hypothetical protein
MNMAIDNVSPNDVENTAQMVNYFSNRMNTLSSDTTRGQFYTTDGMRFQFLTPLLVQLSLTALGQQALQLHTAAVLTALVT